MGTHVKASMIHSKDKKVTQNNPQQLLLDPKAKKVVPEPQKVSPKLSKKLSLKLETAKMRGNLGVMPIRNMNELEQDHEAVLFSSVDVNKQIGISQMKKEVLKQSNKRKKKPNILTPTATKLSEPEDDNAVVINLYVHHKGDTPEVTPVNKNMSNTENIDKEKLNPKLTVPVRVQKTTTGSYSKAFQLNKANIDLKSNAIQNKHTVGKHNQNTQFNNDQIVKRKESLDHHVNNTAEHVESDNISKNNNKNIVEVNTKQKHEAKINSHKDSIQDSQSESLPPEGSTSGTKFTTLSSVGDSSTQKYFKQHDGRTMEEQSGRNKNWNGTYSGQNAYKQHQNTATLTKGLEELSARLYFEQRNRLPREFSRDFNGELIEHKKDDSGSDQNQQLNGHEFNNKEALKSHQDFPVNNKRTTVRQETYPPQRSSYESRDLYKKVRFRSEQSKRLERQEAYDLGDGVVETGHVDMSLMMNGYHQDRYIGDEVNGSSQRQHVTIEEAENEDAEEEELLDVDDELDDDDGDEFACNTFLFCLRTDEGDVIGPFRFDSDESVVYSQDTGLRNRQTGSHNLNEESSRSHSLLTLMIDSETQDPDDDSLYVTKHGKLTFVDLAGSEKVKDSQSTGEQLVESNNINKSLLVLGNCISALGDAKKRQGHIPYRDSKLTKLLADSLGGNGVTLMIACVSPASCNQGETMNTLRYANRAKRIKNKPVVKMDPKENLLLTLRRELKVLRSENHYLRQQLNFPDKPRGKLQKENDSNFKEYVKQQVKDKPSSRQAKEKQESSPSGNKADPGHGSGAASAASGSFASDSGLYEMLQEYMVENESLRSENSGLHSGHDRLRREHQMLSRENDKLIRKLDDLERIMSRSPSLYHGSNANSARWSRTPSDWFPSYDSTPLQTPPHSGYSGFSNYYQSSPRGAYYEPSSVNSSARSRDPRDAWHTPPPHFRTRSSPSELPPVQYVRNGNFEHGQQPPPPPPQVMNRVAPPKRGGQGIPPQHPGPPKPPHRLPPDPAPRQQRYPAAPPVTSNSQGASSYSDKFTQKLEQRLIRDGQYPQPKLNGQQWPHQSQQQASQYNYPQQSYSDQAISGGRPSQLGLKMDKISPDKPKVNEGAPQTIVEEDNNNTEGLQDMNDRLRLELAQLEGDIKKYQHLTENAPRVPKSNVQKPPKQKGVKGIKNAAR